MPQLMLGDEAVALGAMHAGIGGAFSYPGTPATEIFEHVQRLARGTSVAARWSANEKVAYEAALGMSFTGRRALVSMKHEVTVPEEIRVRAKAAIDAMLALGPPVKSPRFKVQRDVHVPVEVVGPVEAA